MIVDPDGLLMVILLCTTIGYWLGYWVGRLDERRKAAAASQAPGAGGEGV